MLNFLRKIKQSFIESGSARKYLLYATGEIALVVIGILIALQINNWNEWRKDRKLEMEILNDLRLNLESNVSLVSGRVDYFSKGLSSAGIILDVIDHRLPYHDSLGVHFSRATRGYGGADVISYVGYESLRNNGFNLISNKFLRDEIMILFENTYRAIISFDETFKLQNAYHQEVVGNFLYTDKQHSLKPFDFDEVMNSKRYYASVSDHFNNYAWMKEETLKGLTETRRALQLINEELDSRK
jgi:hypothetical protein